MSGPPTCSKLPSNSPSYSAGLGLQRMTARVLSTLLFTEQPSVTMGELADRLQASAGAISGALKMLTSVGLAERVPAPGSRRDHYRLREDAWAVLYTTQNGGLRPCSRRQAGSRPPADGGLARRRLTEMRDFYDFLLGEIPAILERWQASRSPSWSSQPRASSGSTPEVALTVSTAMHSTWWVSGNESNTRSSSTA